MSTRNEYHKNQISEEYRKNLEEKKNKNAVVVVFLTLRPDTRLPQTRAGGQGLYLRSLDHLGRRSEAKNRKKTKKVKCDGPMDGPTDGPTKRGVESRSIRPKT